MAAKITIRELITKLGFEADFSAQDRYEKSIDKLKGGMRDLVGLATKAAAGVALLGGALLKESRETANHTADVLRQADAYGVSTDALQEWQYVIESVGADADDFGDLIGTLTDRALEFNGGSQSIIDDFKLIGVTAKDVKGKKPDEILLAIADGFAKTTDEAKRVAAASRILGDDMAKKLTPIMRQGSKGIKAMRLEAHELGVVLDKEALESGAGFAKTMARVTAVTKGIRRELALALIPTLDKGSKKFLDWLKTNRMWLRLKIKEGVRKIGEAFDWTRKKAKKIDDFVQEKIGGWGRVFELIAAAAAGAGILKVLGFIKIAFGLISTVGAAALAKVLAIIAIVATLGVVLQDIWVEMRGGEAFLKTFFTVLFGRVRAFFEALLKRMDEAGGNVAKLAALIRAIGRAARSAFSLFQKVATTAFETLRAVATPIINFLFGYIEKRWELLKKIVSKAWELIKPAIGIILDDLTKGFNGLTNLLDMMDENWEGFVDKIKGYINELIASYNRIIGVVGGPTIDQLQLAPRRQVAEAGDAASVSNTFGGDTNTFEVNGAGGISERELARQIDKKRASERRARAQAVTGREM